MWLRLGDACYSPMLRVSLYTAKVMCRARGGMLKHVRQHLRSLLFASHPAKRRLSSSLMCVPLQAALLAFLPAGHSATATATTSARVHHQCSTFTTILALQLLMTTMRLGLLVEATCCARQTATACWAVKLSVTFARYRDNLCDERRRGRRESYDA